MKKYFTLLHPLLLGIFPVIFLYSHNLGQVSPSQTFIPIVSVIVIILFLFLVTNFLFQNRTKSALLVSFAVILFFSYGYFYQSDSLFSFALANIVIGINKIILFLWIVGFFCGLYFILKTKINLDTLSQAISIFAIVLVLISCTEIIIYQINKNITTVEESDGYTSHASGESPDIYYIIFDEYASSATLNNLFNYDNSEITNYLNDQGFYVASSSTSNYMQTYLSLASSLNMNYLDDMEGKVDKESDDWTMIYEMVKKSNIWRELKKKGYYFYNFRSGYGPTNFLDNYNLNFQPNSFNLDEFTMTLLQTTALRPFIEQSYKEDKRERVLYILDTIPELADNDVPIFVLAHIVSPHSPYVFGPNGEKIYSNCDEKNDDGSWSDLRKKCYTNEITFINSKIKNMVDGILSKSKRPPIIIIQSDHGSKTSGYVSEVTDQFKKERSQIFNAYYLPDHRATEYLYKNITPVNSFRIILNEFFDTNYELLPDKNFYSSQEYPFKFIEVTGDTSW